MSVSFDRDLNDVLVFIEVVSSGSFTAAGRELGVPTSTVSRRVSRLEKTLGVRLLQRTTRALSLTEAGALYHEHASSLFGGLEEIEMRLADAQTNPKGRVRVAAPLEHSISMQLVTPFLSRFPDVRVDLHFIHREVNILTEGFDVAITVGPITNLSVVAHKLMDSPLCLVASPSYLAKHPPPSTPQDLAEHDCILFGGSSKRGSWLLRSDGEEIQVQVTGRFAANHMGAIREAALAGKGIAQLPKLMCATDLDQRTLEPVLPNDEPSTVPIWVTHAPGRMIPPAVRAFVDFVKSRFAHEALRRFDTDQ